MLKKIEVGNVVEGKIIKIKPFGAIVSLPDNTHGLVHISQVSTGFVQNVSDHFAIGDVVMVKVLSIDATTKKISLSIKDVLVDEQKNSAPKSSSAPPQYHQPQAEPKGSFEDKFKDWLKEANDRQAGLNKRNKRR